MSMFRSRMFREIAGGLLLLAVIVLPVFSFASSKSSIYVDADASGTQNGSQSHPFRTISEAIDHADGGDEIHVANGTYKENIEIPENVDLFGEDEDKVILKADDKDEPVVTMNHKSSIDKFTIRGGKHGIRVNKDSRASIVRCIVKDNDKDGISVRTADANDKHAVSITESEIKDNGRAGIFSEKRRIVLIDNVIHDNDSDGADIAVGSKAWIDDNNFRDNNGSGLKLALDKSTIFVASGNTFRDNDHEGLEVNTYGLTGTVNVKKSKFINNAHYGIARINRIKGISSTVWSGLEASNGNEFSGNDAGTLSPIMTILK